MDKKDIILNNDNSSDSSISIEIESSEDEKNNIK